MSSSNHASAARRAADPGVSLPHDPFIVPRRTSPPHFEHRAPKSPAPTVSGGGRRANRLPVARDGARAGGVAKKKGRIAARRSILPHWRSPRTAWARHRSHMTRACSGVFRPNANSRDVRGGSRHGSPAPARTRRLQPIPYRAGERMQHKTP